MSCSQIGLEGNSHCLTKYLLFFHDAQHPRVIVKIKSRFCRLLASKENVGFLVFSFRLWFSLCDDREGRALAESENEKALCCDSWSLQAELFTHVTIKEIVSFGEKPHRLGLVKLTRTVRFRWVRLS